MAKKFGLGKGLGALIPEDTAKDEFSEGIQKINIKFLKPNGGQPRKFFDNAKIKELAESIKEHGIVQPLIVKKLNNDDYEIIAGERRYRAAKIADIKKIPVIVKDFAEETALQIALIENIQREDLNSIEEALAFEELKVKYNLKQDDLAKKLGKSRSKIANTMRLLNLDKRVQEYIIQGVISEGHGKVLLGVEENKQYELATKIIDDELSVRDVEKFLKAQTEKVEKTKKTKKMNPYYKDVKDKLQDHFGTKVNLNTNKNKGKIEIEYYSEEDLQRILDIIQI